MVKENRLMLLLWKNYLLQKRKSMATILEIVIPTVFAILIVLIRNSLDGKKYNTITTWPEFSIDPTATTGLSVCKEGCQVYFAPNSNKNAVKLMDRTKTFLNIRNVVGFATESDMIDRLVTEIETEQESKNSEKAISKLVVAGVVFTKLPADLSVDPVVEYKLRFPSNLRFPNTNVSQEDVKIWKTDRMFPDEPAPVPRFKKLNNGGFPDYMEEYFLTLQRAVDISIIQEVQSVSLSTNTGTSISDPMSIDLRMQRMPFPPYLDDNFISIIRTDLPSFVIAGLYYLAMQIIKEILIEKETRLKEFTKMMGLSGWIHWVAWFIKFFIIMLIIFCIQTVLYTVKLGMIEKVLQATSGLVLLVFFLVYGAASILFCFMISTLFSKASSGAVVGSMIFYFTYIPSVFLESNYNKLGLREKMAFCLLSNTAMPMGFRIISMYEGTGDGSQWSNISKPVSIDDDLALIHVIIMLGIDCAIYGIITWYVEAILPGEFGVPQPWYFPFMKSYWFGSSNFSYTSSSSEANYQPVGREDYFELDPQKLKAGIDIRKLRKEFKVKGKIKASVHDMSLKMYKGQITALLGHNGAGKTTTMSMLTGFLSPTSGTAVVNGHDVRTDLDGVRSSLGFCPQYDILFDTLTVEEHLIFFTKLKGMDTSLVDAEVLKILIKTGLYVKKDAESSTLSGGMKRKLCVGIALTANSKIVILDEPTSGLDPGSRRQIWDILKAQRTNRTMVLSTHFMDEADLLGDRIAIMADGVVQCCGTPLFLKKKYGAGYHMVMVKMPDCVVETITELVTTHIPSAFLESNVSAELSYVLPQEEKSAFSGLFAEIDSRRDELMIASYGVSVTTMEEVFLKVGKEAEEAYLTKNPEEDHRTQNGGQNTSGILDIRGQEARNAGMNLYAQQYWSTFLKRVIHSYRNWGLALTQLLIPLVFIILALIVIKSAPAQEDNPAIKLSFSEFRDQIVAYTAPSTPSAVETELAQGLSDTLDTFSSVKKVRVNELSDYSTDEDVTRYILDQGKKSLSEYNTKYLVAFTLTREKATKNPLAIIYFSNQAYHAIALSLNVFHNALYRAVTKNPNAKITVSNHPLPRTKHDRLDQALKSGNSGFTITFFLLFGLAFLCASFLVFLIKERAVKSKHSQFVSGVHCATFWASTFTWDFINFLIPLIAIVIAIVAFQMEAFAYGGRWMYLILLFVIFIFGMLPYMYLWSFAFSLPSSGFVWMSIINVVTGTGAVIVVKVLGSPGLGTESIATGLKWALIVVLPIYNVGQGTSNLYENYSYLKSCDTEETQKLCTELRLDNPCCKDSCKKGCVEYNTNYLGFEGLGIGKMLVFLIVQFIIYFIIIFLVEMNVFQRLKYCCMKRKKSFQILTNAVREVASEDSDVVAERQRLEVTPLSALIQKDAIIMMNLTKVYDNGHLAVNGLCVGIEKGECFGLLGINGAGKTSSFRMLTGDSTITSGTAYLCGYNIKTHLRQIQRLIGYCPQFDALIDQLTVRETLYMYGRLRGVKEKELGKTSKNLIVLLDLIKHAKKQIKSCSGGNKRKLSTAIALIGDPQIVFLDEPSTGVDPSARRNMWNVLAQVRDSGKTIVLTTHNMEECDALCTKIAIMVNGQFKCLGSPQHLKNKFGSGFTLIIKISTAEGQDAPDNAPVMEFVDKQFPRSTLKDVHEGLVHYQVNNPKVTMSSLFETMERVREELHIDDYSVSQTTLEQIFINFSSAQTQSSPL